MAGNPIMYITGWPPTILHNRNFRAHLPYPQILSFAQRIKMASLRSTVRTLWSLLLLAALTGASYPGPTNPPYSQRDIDSGKALKALNDRAYDNAIQRIPRGPGAACTPNNLKVRKEW